MMPEFEQTARIRIRNLLRAIGLSRHILFAIYLWTAVGTPRRKSKGLLVGKPSKIAIIRLDDVGDFVLTTPFLRAVRSRFPAAHISLIVKPQVLTLAQGCPHVDEVIPFAVVRACPPFDQVCALRGAKRFGRLVLAPKSYDCAIMPRADSDDSGAAAMAYFAGIPLRIGYSAKVLPQKRIKNLGYGRFLTHAIEDLEGSHEVEWSLHAASVFGVKNAPSDLDLWPSATAEAKAAELFGGADGKVPKLLIGIGPGANLGRRKWPIDRFAALAAYLVREFSAEVVVIGGKEDVELGEGMARLAEVQDKVRNLAGALSWPETAAVLKRCKLFIGNDSGPLHVAAAMGAACVEISCHPRGGDPLGANSPARFAPWGVPSAVLRPEFGAAPCSTGCVMSYAHCICAISVREVISAVRALLGRSVVAAPGSMA